MGCRRLWVLAMLLAPWGMSACGDDEDPVTPTDGGTDASDGDAATDASTPPSEPPAPPPPRFMCGGETCFVPGEDLLELFESLGFPTGPAPYSPCCTEDDGCGLVVSLDAGAECTPRPESEPGCPEVDIFGVFQPGCCVEEMGFCGVNGAQVGAGCIDATGGLGPVLGLPPVACGSQDGGVDDAGR